VIKETDTGANAAFALPVQVQCGADLSFIGSAFNPGGAIHGQPLPAIVPSANRSYAGMIVLVNDINASYCIQGKKASQSTHLKIPYFFSM
jgi:hypothetical protein